MACLLASLRAIEDVTFAEVKRAANKESPTEHLSIQKRSQTISERIKKSPSEAESLALLK